MVVGAASTSAAGSSSSATGSTGPFTLLIEERCVRISVAAEDPCDLDIAEGEVSLTSAGERLRLALPVQVMPHAPLNSATYHRRRRRLDLTLRRPFATGAWDMFAEVDKKFTQMQREANRLFGPEVGMGVQIKGEVQALNACEIRVEENAGVVIDLESTAEPDPERPTVILGSQNRILLPWAEEVAPGSSSSSSEEGPEPPDDHAEGGAAAAGPPPEDLNRAARRAAARRAVPRILRQARRGGLAVGPPRAARADGQPIVGGSVFTLRERKEGEVVLYYRGRVLRRSEMLRSSRAQRFYFFMDDVYVMDGGTGGPRPRAAHVSALINSPAGCLDAEGSPLKPNLRSRVDPLAGLGQRAVKLIATRDIEAGEELLYSYGDRYDLQNLSPPSSEDEARSGAV